MSALGIRDSALPEWVDVGAGAPLRQGDVIKSLTSDDDLWHEILLVITADCDLANSKHGGSLTCVPILDHADYLLTFRHEKLRELLATKLTDRITEVHARDSAASSRPSPYISSERLRAWVEETDTRDIIRILQISDDNASDLATLVTALKSLVTETPNNVADSVRVLGQAKLATGEVKDLERAHTWCRNEYSQVIKSLPGDSVFLNELSPAHARGYIIYLRRVVEVNDSAVVQSTSRIPSEARYLRISRLRSPYIYAISQQFGSVFSAVGLPQSHTDLRDQLILRIKNMEI